MSAKSIAFALGEAQAAGDNWLCRCPAHADKHSSLTITEQDGKLLFHCKTGCNQLDVMAALKEKKLLPKRDVWREVARHDYVDEFGAVRYRVTRKENDDGDKRFFQAVNEGGNWVYSMRGVSRLPYRLPELLEGLQTARTIFWVEGEKCADALIARGFLATTSSGGANGRFESAWREYFEGVRNPFVILPDNDEPGLNYANTVAASLKAMDVESKVVSLGLSMKGADIVDFFASGKTAEDLQALIEVAPPTPDIVIPVEDAFYSNVELYSDLWLAHALADISRERLVFIAETGDKDAWHQYIGGRYVSSGAIETYRIDMNIIARIVSTTQEGSTKRGTKALKKLMSYSGQSSILNLAKSFLGHSISEFDSNPLALNVANGIYSLETNTMTSHSPSVMMRHQIPYAFDAAATCPLWDKFLTKCFDGDAEMISFLQMSAGYALSGLMTEQYIWFCYGTGQNGKSKFLETLRVVMGSYGDSCKASLFMRQQHRDQSENPHQLNGIRFVGVNEVGDNDKLDEQLIKDWTGGERITGRYLYGEPFKFSPVGKLWFRGNYKPQASPDDGTWRRMLMIPFEVKISDDERDKDLTAKLLAEKQGILNWLIAGFRKYCENGLNLPIPNRVREATQEYRDEVDALGSWLHDNYIVAPDSPGFRAATLYENYIAWCAATGTYQLSMSKFLRRVKSSFNLKEADHRNDGNYYQITVR